MSAQAEPQLSIRAIALSIVLAVILAAANTYLGLFAGLTIASAIPAAVVSMAVLHAFGGGHILENNIVQTGASAAASIAAGVIFTIPALVINGYWPDFKYWWVLTIAGLGGILGVLFSVPLRRSLIIEQGLAFPEGKAAAEVLRAGDNPAQGLNVLATAGLLGGLGKFAAASGLNLIPDTAFVSGWLGRTIAYFGTNLSPALLGVGYIVGLNIGVVVIAGGIISWGIAIPIYSTWFLDGDAALAARVAGAGAADAAGAIWSAQVRYLGVGAMLIGGIWTLVSLRKSVLSGFKSGLAATRAGHAGAVLAETERDLPMKYVLIGIVLFTLPLLGFYQAVVGNFAVSVPMTRHHGRRRISVLLGVGVHGGSGRLLQQSGLRHHHLHHPVRLAGADAADGTQRAFRPGRGDHDRRRGLLCRSGRWRQFAGSQGGLSGRRHALAAAGDARHRRFFLRAGDGTGAEPFVESVWHWRADAGSPESVARAAGHADGVGVERSFRRTTALGNDRVRRRHRRRDHRARRISESQWREVAYAGARRRGRDLSSTRSHDADLPWRFAAPGSSSAGSESSRMLTTPRIASIAKACCSPPD